MTRLLSLSVFHITCLIMLATVSVSVAAVSSDYEEAPEFKASEILTADMLSGENFRVREEVGSDGYWDIYTVETEFGEFTAHGWIDLRELIRGDQRHSGAYGNVKNESFSRFHG